ncbi:MAG TPA: Smr/MutS family protein [Stellaceae bacterium]|nr:Smr/MutS family protein [Stellaceae bacterium]
MPRPSPDETDLWRRAMAGVIPLPDRRRSLHRNPPAHQAEGIRRAAGERAAAGPVATAPADRHLPAAVFAGIDRRTAERVRRGRYPLEARLDLHGMTQDEAHRALVGFVAGARAEGRRCVLVITGHGRVSGGVLKAATPRWLAEPGLRAHILTIAPARPQHGGNGALYVLLRKADRL